MPISIRKYNQTLSQKNHISHNLDLFGEVIITHHDIFMWVCVITYARFLGRHYDWYVQNYAVVSKIENCKRAGQWLQIVQEYHEKYAAVYKEPCYRAY